MYKKILISAGMIVFVGALYAGATGAFFSDAQTSTGNTFTAGSIVLTVDDTQHYNNAVCTLNPDTGASTWQLAPNQTAQPDQFPVIGSPCDGTWAAAPLGAHKFWNFADVKPGDAGENTISMHVETNPAWACMNVSVTGNAENGVLAPEVAAGDTPANGPFDGELAQNLEYVVWQDNANASSTTPGTPGDNIHQAGEKILVPVSHFATGPITASTTIGIPLADSTTGTGPLPGGSTSFVGVAWCLGTLSVATSTGAVSCDGSSPSLNIAQTDSMTADVTLSVVQSRNNANFVCATSTTGTSTAETDIDVTANDLETNIANAGTSGKWYFFDDTSNVLNNALGTFVAGPATPPFGTGSAQMIATSSLSRTLLTNSGFGGTLLSTISQMAFGEFSHSGVGGANEAPFFRFNVDFTGSNVFQKSLVFVPSDNGAITKDTWQSWDMISGGTAKWEYSGAFWPAGVTTVANTIAGTTPRTWASILADYPAIRMWQAGAQLGIRIGEPGPAGYTGNADFFTIATSSSATTYDFEN